MGRVRSRRHSKAVQMHLNRCERQVSRTWRSRAAVMLIDDDKSVHVLMRRIVEDAGYRYCAAYEKQQIDA